MALSDQVAPAGGGSAAWRGLLVGIGALVLAALVLIAGARAAPGEPRKPFDTKLVKRLKQKPPDFVLIGNSMVETRFDENELNRLLSPAKIAVLGVGGSKSAYWYLALKNVVFAATQPKRVLLFFRRRELTNPREKATGAFAHLLDRVSGNREPVVEAKLAPRFSQPMDRLAYELGQLAPFGRLHALGEPIVQAWAGTVSGAGSGSGRRRQKNALDSIFTVDALRRADLEPASAATEKGTFRNVLEPSLLPDIIGLAERAKVPLTLVRVRTHDDAIGQRRASVYDHELDAYLAERHVELIDMTGAEWEGPELYGEGDHIAPRYKIRYTRLFVEHLGHLFR